MPCSPWSGAWVRGAADAGGAARGGARGAGRAGAPAGRGQRLRAAPARQRARGHQGYALSALCVRRPVLQQLDTLFLCPL